ncbi:iron chelate uptake ABC transporter family permease subunit [uncultured Pseudokineococcus sp.]|uniref:FecCD family ABC transporter permease n=1 Tax=uncultured Pseudokineococcus sp. TaxID=1642928 RepID=UPI002618C3B7|nr:iron ABC transporter permease [uncultured Pseudokineococcus sp.]
MSALETRPARAGTAVVTAEDVARGRRRRSQRRRAVVAVMAVLVVVLLATSLVVGQTTYPPGEVLRVLLGEEVPGASFTVGTLRLPRAVLAVLTGVAFGLGGVTFQTMLRNPLASPDVIGITSAASAAATFGIVTLSLGASQVSTFAIAGGLSVALLIYALSAGRSSATTRLVLVGIGVAAMLDSVTTYLLSEAAVWDQQAASRWLTGSLNGATWEQVRPLLVALALLGPLLLLLSRDLAATQLGDDTASALGVRVGRTRLLLLVAAVGLVAFATAAAGPIAFVAFLSGPIAARVVGPGGSPLVPAALVGALLVLVADLAGQHALGTRLPVGVVTGVLGAPYLVYLVVRTHRTGGSL